MEAQAVEEKSIGVFVGIDWSDRKHDVCLRVAGEEKSAAEVVQQTAEALDAWVARIRELARGSKVAVCVEQSRGALIYALLKYDCFVLYPISGSVLASYREAFRPSRGKDDISDAEFLLELVQSHRDRLREYAPDTEDTRKLQNLVEYRRKVVNEGSRAINRLTSHLKSYFPQVLQWFPNLRTEVACAFLKRWNRLEKLQRASDEQILNFLVEHHSRRAELNKRRLGEIRSAVALVTDEAICEPLAVMVQVLAEQLRVSLEAEARFDKLIETLVSMHADATVFTSLPGAGAVMAARLLAAFGSKRERFKSAGEAAQFFGIAPVVEQSGKSKWTRWRYFCPKFLRQSIHEFAGLSIQYSPWAKKYYALARSRGKSHNVAVRALAFKWLRIIWSCWQKRCPYDEERYLSALKARGSALIAA